MSGWFISRQRVAKKQSLFDLTKARNVVKTSGSTTSATCVTNEPLKETIGFDPGSEGRRMPDGIVVDVVAGHIYWTNMGNFTTNDGSIDRADLDGSNITNIVPAGGTFTPKQLQLDKQNGRLYWCDRESMRVMRCNLDGHADSFAFGGINLARDAAGFG
jgi:hypothetical protein